MLTCQVLTLTTASMQTCHLNCHTRHSGWRAPRSVGSCIMMVLCANTINSSAAQVLGLSHLWWSQISRPEFGKLSTMVHSETGRIRFRGVRFQTPNSVSFLGLTEFRGGSSVSSSQPFICVQKRTHRVFPRTHRVCPKTQ